MMKMLFVRAEGLRWPLSPFLSILGTGPEVADVARRRSLPSNPPARAPSRRGPTSSFDWARRALPVLGPKNVQFSHLDLDLFCPSRRLPALPITRCVDWRARARPSRSER